jgi:hypothetical protein
MTKTMSPLLRLSLLLAAGVLVAAEHRILDLDLMHGPPPADDKRVRVEGGAFEPGQGWRVVGELDRIVFDAGYDIKNGYFEVVVARRGDLAFKERKRNWMGFSGSQFSTQAPGAYARAGDPMYGFSKAEFFASTQSATIGEHKFGDAKDWVLDDRTTITVRAEVKDNIMTWTNSRGGKTSAGSASQPITYVRYASVGGILDRKFGWHHGSLVGLRVLRMTVVDYDPPKKPYYGSGAEAMAAPAAAK